MRSFILMLVLVIGASGCGLMGLSDLDSENTTSMGFCIKGNGPPMSGEGTITGGMTKQGFKGLVTVSPECGIQIIAE